MLVFNNGNAHHKIYSPRVEEGRQSFEWRGHFNLESSNSIDKSYHQVIETEYSWNSYWQSEVEFHISDKTDTPLDWEKTELQNQLQIIDLQYLASALYLSYNFNSSERKGDEIEYKFLNQFLFKEFSLITNFIFEKQIGTSASGSTEFGLSNYLEFSKNILNLFKIGLINFSEFGELSNFHSLQKQEHQIGFLLGKEFLINKYELELELGYLKGITKDASKNTLIWNIEVEF